MIGRPRSSPLFPYPTLSGSRRTGASRYGLYATFGGKRDLFFASLERYSQAVMDPMLEPLEDARLEHGVQDRKSTRLNSSHGYISYAVFCLKKTKQATSKSLL